MCFPGLANFRFSAGSDTALAVAQPDAQENLIRDTYWRSVLPMILQTSGWEALHASAVRMPYGVVAFCARSEMGKSTLAYGLSCRGYPLWADDSVVFESSGRGIEAVSIPFKVRLRPASASFFGEDRTARLAPLSLENAYQAEEETAPLATLCALTQASELASGKTVEIIRLSPTQAFPVALTHAHCFGLRDVERKRQMMRNYLNLVTRAPVIEVRFQTGLEKLPQILDAIEDRVNGRL